MPNTFITFFLLFLALYGICLARNCFLSLINIKHACDVLVCLLGVSGMYHVVLNLNFVYVNLGSRDEARVSSLQNAFT